MKIEKFDIFFLKCYNKLVLKGGIIVNMNKNQEASISIFKIIIISIIILLVTGMGVMAANTKIENVKIVLANNYEMTVLTGKSKISEILDENHIILLPDEKVTPDLESELSDNKTIRISKVGTEETVIAQQEEVSVEQIIDQYNNIVEKIIVEKVVIPYETITKDVSEGYETTRDNIIQQGKDGLREVKYRVRYQNDVEIEKTEISSEIIVEPVNKVVEISKKQVTTRGNLNRLATSNPALTAQTTLAQKVAGITPMVGTFNTSAYTASTCGKSAGSPGYGVTASGAYASGWYTVAAGQGYPIGTVIYIPYFANKPNGGWFVVQDRGGAITNNKLDIYMDTYSECIQFGRRNLECYVYTF